MRSAEQLTRTPYEWHDHQQKQRQQTLRDHLAHMRDVRRERPEWYVWATEGQPALTEAEYEAVSRPRRRR